MDGQHGARPSRARPPLARARADPTEASANPRTSHLPRFGANCRRNSELLEMPFKAIIFGYQMSPILEMIYERDLISVTKEV